MGNPRKETPLRLPDGGRRGMKTRSAGQPDAFIAVGVACAIAALISACGYQKELERVSEKNLGNLELTVWADVGDTGIMFRFFIDDGYLGTGDSWIVSQNGFESRGQDSVFLGTRSRDDITIGLRSGSRTIYSKTIAIPDTGLIGETRIHPDLSVSTSWQLRPDESSRVTLGIVCTSATGSIYGQTIHLGKLVGQSLYHFSGASGAYPDTVARGGGYANVVGFSDVTQSQSDSGFSLRVDFARPLANRAAPLKNCVSRVGVDYTRDYPTENVFGSEEFWLYHFQGKSASIRLDTLASPDE